MRSYCFQSALKFLGLWDTLASVSQIAGTMGVFYQCIAGGHPDSDPRRQGKTISPSFLQSLWIWGHDGWNPGGLTCSRGEGPCTSAIRMSGKLGVEAGA